MRYLSLFSGIEAASVAWMPLGWECVAVAEIDRAASSVLTHRYPDTPNLGNVTKISDERIKSLGHIDLIVGGSPCQDMSIAGKRAGLSGRRSGLFYEQIRIFHAARKFCGTRFLLWENVVGALSSNKGRDFASVVEEMAGLSNIKTPKYGWGAEGAALGDHGMLEWCCLDAQWFGVPQRRRRVFALLDTGNWSDRPPILLEPDSLRGHPPSREKTGQIVAALTANGVGASGADENQAQAGHLIAEYAGSNCSGDISVPTHPYKSTCDGIDASCIAFTCKDYGQDALWDVSPTLRAMGHDVSHANGGGQVAVVIPINDKPTRYDAEPADASGDEYSEKFEYGATIAFNLRGRKDGEMPEPSDVACLRAASGGSSRSYIAITSDCYRTNAAGQLMRQPDIAAALTGFSDPATQFLLQTSENLSPVVRRLTPTECERMDGRAYR